MRSVRTTRRPAWITLVAAAVYLGLAFVPFRGVWEHDPGRWLQEAGTGDIGQSAFFVAQFPYALAHGLNPLANTWANWPYGANFMDNTSIPALAAVASPVTAATSPILALNVLYVATVFADCLVTFLVVLRLTGSRFGSFCAGLLFGFSPMVTAAGIGHIHVMFDLLAPVGFLLLYELATGAGRPVRHGVLLGLAFAVQLYVFPEPAADCALLGVVGLLAAALLHPRAARRRLPEVTRGLFAAGATFAVLAGYGVYVMLAGPYHIHGRLHPSGTFATLSADLASPVLPTPLQRFTLGLGRSGSHLIGAFLHGHLAPDASEMGSYIGAPLLAVLAVGGVLLWRRRLVRWAALLAVAAFVLSLGSRLRLDGHRTGVPLPFALLQHVPVLRDVIASRFAMEEWFFLALLLGIELGALADRLRAGRDRGRARPAGRAAGVLLPLLVAAVALVPLVPRWPYKPAAASEPVLAVSGPLTTVPTGTVVLGYPFPSGNTALMVWQAVDRMRFRIVGAQLIQPSGRGGANGGSSAPPSVIQSVLRADYDGAPAVPDTPRVRRVVAAELVRWRVGAVLWTRAGDRADAARAFLVHLLGPPTVSRQGSAVWLATRRRLVEVATAAG